MLTGGGILIYQVLANSFVLKDRVYQGQKKKLLYDNQLLLCETI